MSRVSRWTKTKPKRYFSKAVDLLGNPEWVANAPSGMAYWKGHGNSLFAEHRLLDQEIAHCVPSWHCDFFYSSVKCFVPPKRRLDVLRISGSINYDGLTKLLTARCASLDANIATLYLGMAVAQGALTIQEVKKKGLYASHIRGEAVSHDEMVRLMRLFRKENRRQYASELKDPFDPLAFSQCPRRR